MRTIKTSTFTTNMKLFQDSGAVAVLVDRGELLCKGCIHKPAGQVEIVRQIRREEARQHHLRCDACNSLLEKC